MSNGWEWKSFTTNGKDFFTQRGYCTLTVTLDDDTGKWSGVACISSPGEDETDGVTITCNKTYATKEEAQEAADKALRKFVKAVQKDLP